MVCLLCSPSQSLLESEGQVPGDFAGLGGSSAIGGRGRRSSFSPWGNAARMAARPWGPSWGVLSTTPQ